MESDEEWVYDLEIEETHCYFAGDILVHNCQDYKGRGSAQGIALAALVGATGRSLLCTGTLLGGYASTIFCLLYRVNPAIRREFGFGEEARWVQRYGIVERITTKDGADEYDEDGRTSKRRAYRTRTIERPGISPAILLNLIGNTVFLRLADVATGLPGYEERVVLFDLDDEDVPLPAGAVGARPPGLAAPTLTSTTSQRRAYRELAQFLREAVLDALQSGSKRLLGAYLQSLLAYPDGCTREEVVLDRGGGLAEPRAIASAPALPADRRYPKERALAELGLRERAAGRRLLIYVGHTETRDLTPRLRAILEAEGLRVAVLKSHTVAADRREEWVAARVREGLDALIVNPRIVQTGLDLLDFPTIAWYQLDYSTYVMRQASRRSWRIGQRADVAVYFFAYRGTLQAEALHLVKQKVRTSLLIEGELPADGLAAADGEEEDSLLALARRLVAPGTDGADPADDRSLEALFAQSRQLEAEADEELLDLTADPALAEALEAHFAEVTTPVPTAVPAPSDQGAAASVTLAAPIEASAAADEAPALAGGRVVRFEDLALALAPRRKGRGRATPAGQLSLFGP